MRKIRIKVVKLGNMPYDKLFERLKKYKSALFCAEIFEKSIPRENKAYSCEELFKLLPEGFSGSTHDVCIAFINERIEGNDFIKELRCPDHYAVSLCEAEEIIKKYDNKIFNFILAATYRIITNFVLGEDLCSHTEKRGCIFDICETGRDIVHICYKPKLCETCMENIKRRGIETDYIKTFLKEIKKIRRPFYCVVGNFIKKHPLLSAVLGFLGAVAIDIASNGITEFFKNI